MVRGTTANPPRFSDEMLLNQWPESPEPKPVAAPTAQLRCPFCEQPLSRPTTSIGSVFLGGLQRLAVAIVMIIGAVLRTARLIVAAALCLVGVVGLGCRAVGLQIAHPHDRRFFHFRNPLRRR